MPEITGEPMFARRVGEGAVGQHAGKGVVTLLRSSVEPFLQFSARRDLREQVWRAFVSRGTGH